MAFESLWKGLLALLRFWYVLAAAMLLLQCFYLVYYYDYPTRIMDSLPSIIQYNSTENESINKPLLQNIIQRSPIELPRPEMTIIFPNRTEPLIHIVQLIYGEDFIKKWSQSAESVECYCKLRGYRYTLEKPTNLPEGPYLYKLEALLHHIRTSDADWLLLLDVDVMVANLQCKLEKFTPNRFLPDTPSIVLGLREYSGEPMSGSVFLRRDEISHNFVRHYSSLPYFE